MAPTATHLGFDTSKPFQLSEEVSLRDETFGALAYHHVTRRLVFLKSPTLVELVRRLHEFSSVDDAVRVLVPSEEGRYKRALASLYSSGLLRG
ncbi:MAG: mycofactocin biosynthesis chaperone MftB [Acidimicrobiales bacterium]